jgi:8-oxo-dGTP pyrophosphatase MutT (NUDIX family)
VILTAALVREALAEPIQLPALGSLIDTRAARAAAVVVPLTLGPEPTAILVLRGAALRDHGGEVGFPGGKPEPSDADLAATALRELEEEIAVPAAQVEILGRLMPTPVITGKFMIHPFVGALAPEAAPRAVSPEIARVLSLPILPILTGERRIAAVSGSWSGVEVFAPHFAVDGCVLYGASAYIFYELLSRLAARLGTRLPDPEIQHAPPWGDRYSR